MATSENSENINTNNIQVAGTQAAAVPTQQNDMSAGVPLSDFALQLEDFTPAIPDAVIKYFLRKGGMDTSDPRVIRMISVASQKLISDIANDALQHCKMKASAQSSKKQGKDKKFNLTMEDLTLSVTDAGINTKKPSYYI
ncbi:Transcription initiation factor TFIID subunit 10 [Nucella lapillus]